MSETRVLRLSQFLGGMDASGSLDTVEPGFVYKAINAKSRKKWSQRPGFVELFLKFSSDVSSYHQRLFQRGYFQGAYLHDNGERNVIVCVISGMIFVIDPEMQIISMVPPPTNQNTWLSPLAEHCWFARHECGYRKYLIIQDGVSRPVFMYGSTTRYSDVNNVSPPEYPTATAMASCQRLLSWIDVTKTLVYHGDRYQSTNPVNDLTAGNNNYYLGEGSHGPTSDMGKATGMVAMPILDSGTGLGTLLVGYERGWISIDLTVSRTQWPNLDRDIVKTITLGGIGNQSPSGIATVNTQVFFVHTDGLRALSSTRQDAQSRMDNIPLSREVGIWLDPSAKDWKYCSLMSFQQRLLWTNRPERYNRKDHDGRTISDIRHRGILAYDFWTENVRKRRMPQWDGLWTGIFPEKNYCLVEGKFGNRERGFVFGRGKDSILRLYEIREDIPYDAIIAQGKIIKKRIPWQIETGVLEPSTIDAYGLQSTYSLEDGSLGLSDVNGKIEYAIKFKPDQYPEYTDWFTGDKCAQLQVCFSPGESKCEMPNLREHVYVNILLGKPAIPKCNQATGKLLTLGHGFSFMLEFVGAASLEYFTAKVARQPKMEMFGCESARCTAINVCQSDDYSYDLTESEYYYE